MECEDNKCNKDDAVSKYYEEVESMKEQNFVNLMIDIILSKTRKQLDEEGD